MSREQEELNCEYEKTHSLMRSAIDKLGGKTETSASVDLGKDLWKQLKRISIPIFDGNKRKYDSWKAAFMSCVDAAPAMSEYKLLQLRQYLSGDALKAIENLGHSPGAYNAAKERLERKFGGQRRRINFYLEELARFPVIKEESAMSIEKFVDLIEIAYINLKESDPEDLNIGLMYRQLLKKLPESMISRFKRWLYEKGDEENNEKLKEWVLIESEFQTVAMETKFGIENKTERHEKAPRYMYDSQRAKTHKSFFTKPKTETVCKLCNGSHGVWRCEEMKKMPVNKRWEKAKLLKLSFRCLDDMHVSRDCRGTKKCDVDRCDKVHHRILHVSKLDPKAASFEPKDRTYPNVTQNIYIALRTVPVLVRANGKE